MTTATASKFLTREQILSQKKKFKTKVISVPEWGGDICLAQLTCAARQDFESAILSLAKKDGQGGQTMGATIGIRERLVAAMIVDNSEDQNRLFEAKDIPALGDLSFDVLSFVYSECQKFSGLSTTAEEVEKN